MGDIIRETRNRSRSKTPFLRSQCDNESCAHAGEEGHTHHHHEKKKKTPNVQTIIEETVEVTSSPLSPEKSKKSTSSKTITSTTSSSSSSFTSKSVEGGKATKTSDYSSEDASPETVARIARSNAINKSGSGGAASSSSFSSTTTTTVITTSGQRLHGNKNVKNLSSAAMTSTPKTVQQQSFTSVFGVNKEIGQNALNSDFERSGQFSGSNNSSSKISYTEQTNGSLGDHVAYKEYKDAGEYWNKFPKTDYTYSKRSPHRREILPGVIAMPNMSRRSLENHHDRVTEMIQREPAKEEFIRRRYAYQCGNSTSRKAADSLIYDSQDEVDLAQFESYKKSKRYLSSTAKSTVYNESWFTRILTTVVTTFYSFWGAIVGESSESELYKTRIAQEERGFFGSIGHAISSVFIGLFRYVYLAISSILSLDTWLLKSSNAENKNKKRFLLLLLILLPLLLLAAWALLEEHERHALIIRAYNLLPLTLASLRNSISAIDLKTLFTLPNLESSQYTTIVGGDITSSLKKSLSPEEYENILNHVNVYVQKLVDAKMEEQKDHYAALNKQQQSAVSHETLLIIANTVRENIQKLEPILVKKAQSDLLGDKLMQRIVENVQLELKESKWTPDVPLTLSEDNLKQISNMIHENIEINNHHYNIIEKIDVDEFLLRILRSPKLADFIDSRILEIGRGSGDAENEMIARQQLIINELNKEIAFIKTTLSDKLSENEDLHYSINSLKLSQDDLMKRVDSHESLVNDRFGSLLAEIEQKLSLLRNDQFVLINKQVKFSLIDILGYKDSGNVDNIDLQNWIRNTFVAKEFLEQKLIELSAQSKSDLKEEIDRSGMILMKQISEKLKVEILRSVDAKQKQSAAAISGEIKMALSENEIRKIVKGVLSVYDADKTGLVDFALESAGGQILSTRCTENYQIKTAQISIFGIPLWYPSNTPRIAISPNVQPGECWAFQGFPGFLVLRLNTLIHVSGFTLEHIPKSLTPNGKIDSAPRNFTVWGLEHENDHEPVLFAWALLEEHERHALIIRAYNLLPLTLASLRNSISAIDLKTLFTLPNLESSQYTTIVGGDITSSLKKSLSPEEYENILNHVNVYVQKLVDAKMEEQKDHYAALNKQQQSAVSHETLLIIANTVRENIQKLEPILVKKAQSDLLGDKLMQRIVENVQLELKESKWTPDVPLTLSEDNLKQISNMIHENIEINNHHYNIIEKIDVDEFLLRILRSPKLAVFIDSRILEIGRGSGDAENEMIARQQLIINELNKEIAFIKTTLSDKLSENEDLHYSINSLKMSQDDLMKRVDNHESLVNDRFGSLLAEIEQKLSLLRNDQFVLINKQVKLSLIDILGYKDSGNVDNIDLQNWIRNTFVAKEFLEQKLIELSAQSKSDLKEEIDRSGMILMKQISEKLKVEILRSVDAKQKQSAAAISGEIKMALSENEIRKIVKGVLSVYDADKTGLVDFALESAGGQILSTRCTENYQIKTAQISIFGIPLWYPSNTPRIAISPNVQPGECWAFQGFPGFLVLRLNTLIHVSGFTLEHIPKSLTPNGKIDSAPRNFTVWGLEHENDHEPVLFGEYEFVDNDAPLQYFPVQNESIDRLFDIVEMRIETNHGNPKYTCLYRFRVHGKPPSVEV